LSKKEKKEVVHVPPQQESEDHIEPGHVDLGEQIVIINNMEPPGTTQDKYRTVLVCGDITEEASAQIMHSLFYYASPASTPPAVALGDNPPEVPNIDFNISTCGGSAIEMFGIYDVMRGIRETVPIHTYGIGKVMSAGVLLLAAGTKGQRRIGRNCRVMIHGVMGGYHGNLTNMENEINEVKWIQERYIENLVEESFLSKKRIKAMLNKQVDVYLSAEQAVKYGIADIVV